MNVVPHDAMRFSQEELMDFCLSCLSALDVAPDMQRDVAEVLIEGDLLGHDTHGLALLPMFLDQFEKGVMSRSGSFKIISQRKATAVWDGERLPGPWLVRRAVELALEMAKDCGTGTVVLRRSQHIGCLAAYLEPVTRTGHVMLLASSDPSAASVAAHGGREALFTPNPLAFGFPTEGDPVLADISASLVTNGMARRLASKGEKLVQPWLLDAEGEPTDDPAVLFARPSGAILPLGGIEAGHKGFALTLLVEMLTGGLAGSGRADPSEGPGATVYLHILDPVALGGEAELRRQMQWITDACHRSETRPGVPRVRMPGEQGLRRRRMQVVEGVGLRPEITRALEPWANKLNLSMPAPVQGTPRG